MSADNGIYILKLKDQFRVIHAQAIENLWYWYETETLGKINALRIFEYFSYSIPFTQESDASRYAFTLAKEYEILEYGVSVIDDCQDKTWNEIVEEARVILEIEEPFAKDDWEKELFAENRKFLYGEI